MIRHLHFTGLFLAAAGLLANDEVVTTFTYTDPNATTVEVAGEFSNWKTLPLAKDTSGTWARTLQLKAGQYGYKFVVNGDWKLDPNNSARKSVNGIENSAITVGDAAAPTPAAGATFAYADPVAKVVSIAGQFNNWSPTANPLKKNETGIWTVTIPLKAGKQQYKFVVDGDWRIDPTNPDFVDDADGNRNSIKTVVP
jgi:1,4-alpha-glucan branching enzyme